MGYEVISSPQNPQIKRLHQLLERKGRDAEGSFLVEGVHLVEEALRSDAQVITLVYDADKGIDAACERALSQRGDLRIKTIAASAAVLGKLSETKTPQGIIAEVKKPKHDWVAWLRNKADGPFVVLLLDELQDPGNVGTMLRTAEAAGIDAVVLGEGSVDLYNGKVVRATMGALFRLPIFSWSLTQAAERLKELGGRLLVTTLNGESKPYDQVDYQGKIGIVIGNEARGVSATLLSKASHAVHIPIYGQAESLNAAVAAGIVMYEAARQRKNG